MSEAVRVSAGEMIDYTPGSAVAAGQVVVQGHLVGIATRPIAAGALGALAVTGVFDVAKGAGTIFAAGARVFWDDTANLAVATSGAGANEYLGMAVAAAGAGETTVRVRLGHASYES